MSQTLSEKIQNQKFKFSPIDSESVEIINRISKSTGANAMSIIHEALQIFEKSLGRQLIVRKPDSKWDLTINKYKDYKPIIKFEPEK